MRQAAITAVCALIWGALSPTLLAQSEAMGADCGCLWEGSFSEVAPAADLVMIGEVRSIKGNAVDLVPEQVLKGAFWLDTLRVWMQTRDYCRPPATYFPAGSRWIMALSEIRKVPEDGFNPSTPNQSFGRPFDYTLSSCGGYWLRVQGKTATGNLVPGMPRFYHEPDMSPVLVDLVEGYIKGSVSTDVLTEASRERPEAVNELILDTRSFLRGQADWLPDNKSVEPADEGVITP